MSLSQTLNQFAQNLGRYPPLDPSMLTNWSRTRIIDAIRGEFGLARALQATGLKRGTYYYERGVIVAGDK